MEQLNAWELANVASYCSPATANAIPHLSRRLKRAAAPAADGEVFSRARVLGAVDLFCRALEPRGGYKRAGPYRKHTAERHLAALLLSRCPRALRRGTLSDIYARLIGACFVTLLEEQIYEFPPSMIRAWYGRYSMRPEFRGLALKLLERFRRQTERRCKRCPPMRGPAFAALDVAIRRGTQPPGGASPTWLHLERELRASLCPQCLRFRDERKPAFHPRGADLPACAACEMMPWAKALRQYRLTPEQLPRGPVWRRMGTKVVHGRRVLDNASWRGVPMVLRRNATAAAARVWGDPRDGRAAKAKTRSEKKKRRRRRDARKKAAAS